MICFNNRPESARPIWRKTFSILQTGAFPGLNGPIGDLPPHANPIPRAPPTNKTPLKPF